MSRGQSRSRLLPRQNSRSPPTQRFNAKALIGKKDSLNGILGNRSHHIFGDAQPDVVRLEELEEDDGLARSPHGSPFGAKRSVTPRRLSQEEIKQQTFELAQAKGALTNILLDQHNEYMEGRR